MKYMMYNNGIDKIPLRRILNMKFLALYLLLSCTFVFANLHAQQVSLRFKDAQFQDVAFAIQKQTRYSFTLNKRYLDISKPVTIQISNVNLEAALQQIFKNQPFAYTIKDKVITLVDKPITSSSNVRSSSSDQENLRGQVIDSLGNPVQHVSVTIKGTPITALTDQFGQFNIQAKKGQVASFRILGYQPKDIALNEMFNSVVLYQIKQNIEEVSIVSTGYQTLSRERASGSFGVIKESELEMRSNFNIASYLEGQVSGLSLSSDGAITIRGQSTFSADRNPLIVVDGFPIERSISTINPNDVESITVLKDASAASIWGVRAANGVIVIQTKRGKSSMETLNIEFGSTLSVSNHANMADLNFGSSNSFMELEKHKVDRGLIFFSGIPRPSISPLVDAYMHTPQSAEALKDNLAEVRAYNEFTSLFMRPSTRQQYTLGISGKSNSSSFRSALSYDKLASQWKSNSEERLTADLFNSSELFPRLRMDMGINVVYGKNINNSMSFSDIRTLLPYQHILGSDGMYINQPRTFYQDDKDNYVDSGYPYDWNYNLFREWENKDNQIKNLNVNALAGLNYKINKDLTFNVAYQYELIHSNGYNLFNEESYFVRNLINTSTSKKGNDLIIGIPKGSIFDIAESRKYSHSLRGLLRYDIVSQNNAHALSALAGTDIREVGLKSDENRKYGYDPQSLQFARVDYLNSYIDVRGNQQSIAFPDALRDVLDRFVSFYGNAGYTYLDRYTLNASARLDQTNLFGSSDQYKNVWLWSGGASWQLHKEAFFRSNLFQRMILRATYGINGNVDRSTSPFLIANTAINPVTNLQYAYISNPQNPLLRWERTAVTNLGIDFSLLANRLQGSVEYYVRKSSDLLGNSTVNGTYGFEQALINYASMENRGVEFQISTDWISRDVKWNTTINFGYNKNKVTHVDFPQRTVGAFTSGTPQAGLPLNYIYSYRWAGLSAEGAPQVFDVNGDAIGYQTEMSNVEALRYQGTVTAPYYGGVINTVEYKGFSLLTNFTYKFGHYFRTPVIQYEPLLSEATQVPADWDDRWKMAGDEAFTSIPAVPNSITGLPIYDRYTQQADIRTANAGFIRFREFLLNYQIPQNFLVPMKVARAMVGFQIRNLANFYVNKSNLDPEYLVYENKEMRNNLILPLRPEYSLLLKVKF